MASTNRADSTAPATSWIEAEVPAPAAAAELEAAGHPPWLARLLARRGVSDPVAAEEFLAPAASQLHDPLELAGMAAAVERLVRAREADETVLVVGDYDVDGVTAVALLAAVFTACGLRTETIVPHRLRDGYGLQESHAAEAVRRGASVLVTADCGSLAYAAVAKAVALGLDVIITDHHIPGPPHPPEVVHINPHRPECRYPFSELSGVGLALKLAQALAARVGRAVAPELLLRVASLGTVADMVPLRGENRTIAAVGLAALATTRSPGLRALMDVARVAPPVTAADVGFRLGPRLNAAGRMDSADDALRLLLTRDPAEARSLAARLDALNSRRQLAESSVVEAAIERLEARPELPRVIVDAAPEWHRGVVGIAAGRLARRFHRPTILLALEGGEATGSGRSIPGIDLHGVLAPFSDRLERFGGHAQAVGLTVQAERLAALDEALQRAAGEWDASLLVRRHLYESHLDLAAVDESLAAELARLEPFGVGNPRPVFRFGPLARRGEPRLFGNDHLGFEAVTVADRTAPAVPLVGWGWGPRAELFERDFELLAKVGRDTYLDRVRLEIVDARRSDGAA